MRTFNILISCLITAALVAAAPAFGAEMNHHDSSMMNQSNQNPNEMSSSSFSRPIDLSFLLHKTVRDEQGRTFGKVSDVVIGPNGQAQFVILSRTGMIGRSEKFIPVPWKTFTTHWTNVAQINEDRPVVLSLAQDRLDKAPGFSNRNELTNSATRQKVCQYFKGDCAQNAYYPNSAS